MGAGIVFLRHIYRKFLIDKWRAVSANCPHRASTTMSSPNHTPINDDGLDCIPTADSHQTNTGSRRGADVVKNSENLDGRGISRLDCEDSSNGLPGGSSLDAEEARHQLSSQQINEIEAHISWVASLAIDNGEPLSNDEIDAFRRRLVERELQFLDAAEDGTEESAIELLRGLMSSSEDQETVL